MISRQNRQKATNLSTTEQKQRPTIFKIHQKSNKLTTTSFYLSFYSCILKYTKYNDLVGLDLKINLADVIGDPDKPINIINALVFKRKKRRRNTFINKA